MKREPRLKFFVQGARCVRGAFLFGIMRPYCGSYKCRRCHSRKPVYNSCIDRHCPQCGGGKRANWLDKTSVLILPNVNYFQVVFTLPDKLSSLMLGNRKPLYDLLFHAAWRALDSRLREQQFQPAAQLVLHT